MMKTNTEVLTYIMEHSKHGALMQGFIMTALEKYAESVLAVTEEPADWPALLGWGSWHGCAEELAAELDKHFKRNTTEH